MADSEEMNDDIDKQKIEVLKKEGFLEIVINSPTFLREQAKNFQAIEKSSIDEGYQKFLINFNTCQYISSEGLGCIAEFWRKCNENKDFIMVALFNQEPANELLNFFEIIGLARVMKGHIFTEYEKAEGLLLGR